MSVYDKELVINGKAVRSPEQQVYKNMKDIKALQEVIKPEYTTDSALTSSSVSVAIANTNAPEGTTEGWIITQDGLKFKITGGDETNLLLEFYADLKGPQGETGPSGAELEIDDSGTSAAKVWSSEKVSNELAQAGKTYYQHTITLIITETKRYISLIVINDSATPFTYDTLNTYLSDKGFNSSNVVYSANGTYYESGYGIRMVYGVFGSTEINAVGTVVDSGLKDTISISGATIIDTVITL